MFSEAVSTSNMLAAAAEGGVVVNPEELLDGGFENDDNDDFFELRCAFEYLLECGVAREEIRSMTIEKIVGRYHKELQGDVVILIGV